MNNSNFKLYLNLALVSVTAVLVVAVSASFACDIAVVSGKVTTNGRPLIWKNRDNSVDWHQQMRYFEAETPEAGGYMMVYNYDEIARMNNGDKINPSGGLNAAGFANACTSVYEDFNPIHEAFNINTDLIRESLQKCVTVEDFESLLMNWRDLHPGKVISGNFVVIDASGGASLFECYTGNNLLLDIKFTKFDANNGEVKEYVNGEYVVLEEAVDDFIGFYNRANNHTNPDYITINFGEERKIRATDILNDLATADNLNYRTVMREVSKDVTGDQVYNPGSSDERYSTTYCISRNNTRLGLVVDGVEAGENPALSTFWCALGEPSIAVYAPYFVAAEEVSYLSYIDGIGLDGTLYDFNATSMMTRASNRREAFDKLIYKANTGNAFFGMDYKLMNKLELYKVQAWSFVLEDDVLDKTEDYIDDMRDSPVLITRSNLSLFSNYCVEYIYNNYQKASFDFYPWTFIKPWE
ncbi:MAG: hypothetical protein SWH68_01965 [Thermodesulfobacteriota bacterium]|nr:hypothetical protein [Thermodesulfobacteriota bacterium]